MRVLILGLGSIGARYLRLLLTYFPEHWEVFALRSGVEHFVPPQGGYTSLVSWDEVAEVKPQVALICNPTLLHVETAHRCVELGAHVFIEKPLSNTMAGVAELASAIDRAGVSSYVAYPLRFLPQVANLRGKSPRWARFVCRTYFPLWRPGRNHLETYSAHKNQGGGAVLDLSHEIDLAFYLFGPFRSMHGIHGRRGNVTVDADDFADIIIEHESGTKSYIHLDLAWSGSPERYFETSDSVHIDIQVTDDIYLAQLLYFFNNLGKPVMNDIHEASYLLGQIVRL